ncbi:MAG: TonB-dependent receptor [Pseudomonadales bacterium]|nr:TonB-dependent receptor [Pseudomonadales bacterium]
MKIYSRQFLPLIFLGFTILPGLQPSSLAQDFNLDGDYQLAALDVQGDKQWYEKSFQDILNSKIVTSTRNESSVNDVPGVVSVFTRQDIQRMGLRSIKELLERTTGFFINRQLTGATIGSRGFIADTDQFLLLIDGHSLNSIIDRGMGESFLFPNLDHVKRVEIIRGPGSTLWGSDASLGVIHIITNDGADIDGARVSVNKSDDQSSHMSVQIGEQITDDIDVMASLTLAESEGFDIVALAGSTLDVGRWDEMKDSYEFYAKAQVRNITVKARAFQSNISRPDFNFFNTGLPQQDAYSQRSHYYLDITHKKSFSTHFNLETRVFSDILQRVQSSVTPLYTSDAVVGIDNQASQEDRLGFEMIARWKPVHDHHLLFGIKKVKTKISPVTESVYYPIETSLTSTTGTINHLVVPEGVDDNTAIFIEDDWQVLPNKLSLLMGIRLDKNNLREDNLIALPRFAINWRVYEPLQIKYSYNTGYIRPSAGIGFLGQERFFTDTDGAVLQRVGIKESQEIASHDIQFIYTRGRFRSNINFYYTDVKNPFQILYEKDDALVPTRVAYYVNTNTITTTGTELELAYQFNSALDIYASLAYVFDASIESMTGSHSGIDYDLNKPKSFGAATFSTDGTMSGYPHLISHLGMNWNASHRMVANVHLRYWDDMTQREAFSDAYNAPTITLGPEFFVDANIRFAELFSSGLDAAVYIKNVLDNADSETTMLLFHNVWQEQGRRIGASLSYKF